MYASDRKIKFNVVLPFPLIKRDGEIFRRTSIKNFWVGGLNLKISGWGGLLEFQF